MAQKNDRNGTECKEGDMKRITVHPGVQAFMDKNGIDEKTLRSGGRLVLKIDNSHRIVVHSASFQRTVMTADLLPIPDSQNMQQDNHLVRLMQLSTGMLLQHASALAIDQKRGMLVLQQSVPADAPVESMESAIADLLNVLPFWRAACSDTSAWSSA
jgi:hypothetical protein